MNFIQLLFFTIPLLFLTGTILYAVFKIKEMKRKGNYSNQRTTRNDRETLAKNGFKSTAIPAFAELAKERKEANKGGKEK